MTKQSISILDQRRIEAAVIKPLMEGFEAELGREKSRAILSRAIKKMAREKGRQMADGAPDITLAGFASLLEPWYRDGALEIETLEESPDRYHLDITRCRYAEMYREMGLDGLGFILSCDRDAALIEGFNPALELKRTKTIMQGGDCCDFRYSRKDQE